MTYLPAIAVEVLGFGLIVVVGIILSTRRTRHVDLPHRAPLTLGHRFVLLAIIAVTQMLATHFFFKAYGEEQQRLIDDYWGTQK